MYQQSEKRKVKKKSPRNGWSWTRTCTFALSFKESERGAIEGNETRRMECGSEVSGSRTKDDVLGQLSLSARCGGVL